MVCRKNEALYISELADKMIIKSNTMTGEKKEELVNKAEGMKNLSDDYLRLYELQERLKLKADAWDRVLKWMKGIIEEADDKENDTIDVYKAVVNMMERMT